MEEATRLGRKEKFRVGVTAHVRVEEPLKGVTASRVDVLTGASDADCGYPFRVGERYLVYAYQADGALLGSTGARTAASGRGAATPRAPVLGTNICGRTRRLADAQDDLDLLRALIAGKPDTRIFGSVVRLARPPGTDEFRIEVLGPLAGVPVRAEGGGGSFVTKTDASGRYRFLSPPPGTYEVSVQPPAGYAPLFSPADVSSSVIVERRSCSGEHHVSLQLNGRISGRVLDARGRPVPDQVRVSVLTRASAGKGFGRVESRSDYTKDGRYEIDGLPPGEYLLGVGIVSTGTPNPTLYYPGASELKGATVITLGPGQQLIGLDMHVRDTPLR